MFRARLSIPVVLLAGSEWEAAAETDKPRELPFQELRTWTEAMQDFHRRKGAVVGLGRLARDDRALAQGGFRP